MTDVVTSLKGRTLSVSVRVRTSTANAVRIGLNNYFAGASHFTYSAYHSGGGAYETLTVTATMDNSLAICQVQVLFAASCTAYIDNAMLVVGSVPADYAPLHPADDLARCLRYYEVLGVPAGTDVVVSGNTGASAWLYQSFPVRTEKPVTPTATVVGTWGYTNASGLIAAVATTRTTQLRITTTAAGYASATNNGANTCVTLESNP
jgi:hypothetical protein